MYDVWAEDVIKIEGLEVFAHHGVFPEEKEKGQKFLVNAALHMDARRAGREDALALSTDYGDLCHFITRWMQENTCRLLEAVAERLSEAILLKYQLIAAVDLEIRKPEAPIDLPFGYVSVEVHRGWHRVYLAVGSNIGFREHYIEEGVNALRIHPLICVKKVSQMIRTKPYGGVEQEDFLNGALEIETLLTPEELLEALHRIEDAAGRTREVHWGPRTLDLDILFYDKLVYESDDLTIPHVDLENREFVLEPLREIAPGYRHPVLHRTVEQLAGALAAESEPVTGTQ